jgi:hypothetical protein
MKIGDRKYQIRYSDCWLTVPNDSLTVNFWTDDEKTYLITEPIKLDNTEELFSNYFQSEFSIQSIDDIDSTLLEKDVAIDIWNQKISFDTTRLLEIKKVQLIGQTSKNETVQVDTETSFCGFEILKQNEYYTQVTNIETILRTMNIQFNKLYDIENNLIRIEIKTKPNINS